MKISKAEQARWKGLATALLARVPADVTFPVPKGERVTHSVPVELQGCTREELEALANDTGLPFDVELE